MFTHNPFSPLTAFLPPRFMQVYIVLMIFAVAIGTVFDLYHKRSAQFFCATASALKGCRHADAQRRG
jgi:uncharacterized membrane protein